jgi:hypothetical protein
MTAEQGFRLHPLAAQDITDIWEYIAEDNPVALIPAFGGNQWDTLPICQRYSGQYSALDIRQGFVSKTGKLCINAFPAFPSAICVL